MGPVARFLALFGGLVGAYYAVALWRPFDRALYDYLAANAQIAGACLRCLGVQAQVHGLSITSPVFAIAVRRGCDGIEPAWIFSAAVMAFPKPLRRKLAVLPVGIILILAVNVVRIVSLFLIGWRLPLIFPFAHLELWPAAFMVLVIVMWVWWVRPPREFGPRGHGPA